MGHHHLAGRCERKAASGGRVIIAFVPSVPGLFVFMHIFYFNSPAPVPQGGQFGKSVIPLIGFLVTARTKSNRQEQNHE